MAGEILVNSVLIFLPVVIMAATFVVCFGVSLVIVDGLNVIFSRLGMRSNKF